jgi:AbrB family looped-hinge helix DNA binding protein
MGTARDQRVPKDKSIERGQHVEVRVGEQGRVVLPAGVRAELGVTAGTVLVVRTEGSRIILEPRDAIRARLHERFGRRGPLEPSVVEELLDERRKEAWLEEHG